VDWKGLVVFSWWLVVGGWWLVVGGWWLVVGGWWLVVGEKLSKVRTDDGSRYSSSGSGRCIQFFFISPSQTVKWQVRV
jgi:hypothetical protein